MQYLLPKILVGTLLLGSAPALFYFSVASNNLMKYESATKKAAQYSTEAGRQLRKTRTTMGTALFAAVVSLVSSGSLLYDFWTALPGDEEVVYRHAKWSMLNVIAAGFAQLYVSGFWKGAVKAPVPGMIGYNDAVRATENGLWWCEKLAGGWGVYLLYAMNFGKGDS